MSQLTATGYSDLCVLVGNALDHPRPRVQEIGTWCDWPVAVYLLAHRHPLDNGLIVDYAGSAVRRGSDVSARLREHLRDASKRERFSSQMILPLRTATDLGEVRRLEGVVARALGVPRWCKRIPGGCRRTGAHKHLAVP
jgi:hypothetical protein